MATVQGGDGQHVHHGKNDRDECGDVPEGKPVPSIREDAADSAETSQALGSLGREDELELLHIVHHLGPTHLNATGHRLQQVVTDNSGLEYFGGIQFLSDSNHALVIDRHIGCGEHLVATLELDGHRLALILLQFFRETDDFGRGDVIHSNHPVTLLQASLLGAHAGLHLIHHHGNAVNHERLSLLGILVHLEDEVLGYVDYGILTVALHRHLVGSDHVLQTLSIGMVKNLAIGFQGDITILEANLMGAVAIHHTLSCVGEFHVFFAHAVSDAGIDDNGQQEVEHHAAQHDEQALPCRLAAELIGLGGLFQCLGIHRFVNHAADGTIATQRQPTDAILGGTPRLLVFVGVIITSHCHFIAMREPFQVLAGFPLGDSEPGIEEKIEFFYPYSEDAGKEVVTKFMYHHQNAQRKNKFKGFNPKSSAHYLVSLFYLISSSTMREA